jgi:hypothetical protein
LPWALQSKVRGYGFSLVQALEDLNCTVYVVDGGWSRQSSGTEEFQRFDGFKIIFGTPLCPLDEGFDFVLVHGSGFHLSGFDCPLDSMRGFLLVFIQALAITTDFSRDV